MGPVFFFSGLLYFFLIFFHTRARMRLRGHAAHDVLVRSCGAAFVCLIRVESLLGVLFIYFLCGNSWWLIDHVRVPLGRPGVFLFFFSLSLACAFLARPGFGVTG